MDPSMDKASSKYMHMWGSTSVSCFTAVVYKRAINRAKINQRFTVSVFGISTLLWEIKRVEMN